MSQHYQWPMPAWHDSLRSADQGPSKTRILLSLAAVYATEAGTASGLADALGMKPSAILQARARGIVSPEMAIKLEELLGRAHFPRELFRPDLFLIER